MSKRKSGNKWRWLIALACCWCNCMLYGVSRLSGLLLIYFIEDLHITRASAAIPFSVSTSLRNLSGPFVGYLAQKFGIRLVCSCGCLLATLGIALCFVAQSVFWTTMFWGILFGIGYGMGTTLLPQVINQNFEKFRSTASGIAYSGAYIGSSVFPIFLSPIIKEYGFAGGFLMLAGIVLHSLLAAMMFRSPEKKTNQKMPIPGRSKSLPASNLYLVAEERKKIYSRRSCVYPMISTTTTLQLEQKDMNHNPLKHGQLVLNICDLTDYQIKSFSSVQNTGNGKYPPKKWIAPHSNSLKTKKWTQWLCPTDQKVEPKKVIPKISTKDAQTRKKIGSNDITNSNMTTSNDMSVNPQLCSYRTVDESHSLRSQCSKPIVDDKPPKAYSELAKIFRNPMFCIVCVTSSMYSFITSCILTIIEDYAKDMGTPESLVYLVLMILSLSNLFGSLSLGWITDRALISRRLFVIICYLGMALSLVIIPSCCDFNEILILVSTYGVLEAGVLINSPLLLAECIEDKRQVLAIASRDVLSAPTVLLVPVVLSVFRDRLGSYNQVFYLLSVTSLLCSAVWIFVPGVLRKRLKIPQIQVTEA